jgi:hypothetical protein
MITANVDLPPSIGFEECRAHFINRTFSKFPGPTVR